VDFTPSGMSGQDADFSEDHKNTQHFDDYAGFSSTKIDRAGNPLTSDNLCFSCVKNIATGLTWEVKSPEQVPPTLQIKRYAKNWPNSFKKGIIHILISCQL